MNTNQFSQFFSNLGGMDDWGQFVNSRKAERYRNQCTGREYNIPPLNTDITLASPVYQGVDHQNTVDSQNSQNPPPSIFSWRSGWSPNGYPIVNSALIEKKKKYIGTPANQHLCGACWAFSTAGCIGDSFVICDMLYGYDMYKPNISPTWLLTTYPQKECGGGSVSSLLNYLSSTQTGVASSHCIDYSWCIDNPLCDPNEQRTSNVSNASESISGSIPNKGCYDEGDHLLYKIARDPQPSTLSLGKGGMTTETLSSHAKAHIYNSGPIIGGFVILSNFPSGDFTNSSLSTRGIYFERGQYTNSSVSFGDLPNVKGGHAIAIIGWGSDTVVSPLLDSNDKVKTDSKGDIITGSQTVPYWYCRNSWGVEWGTDGGYFKMAMYPHNTYSQFDMIVDTPGPDGGNSPAGGGMYLFYVNEHPVLDDAMGQVESKYRDIPLLQSSSYYAGDGGVSTTSPSVEGEVIGLSALGIIILIIAAMVVYFIMTRNRKKK
jgi:hypothetical protein